MAPGWVWTATRNQEKPDEFLKPLLNDGVGRFMYRGIKSSPESCLFLLLYRPCFRFFHFFANANYLLVFKSSVSMSLSCV